MKREEASFYFSSSGDSSGNEAAPADRQNGSVAQKASLIAISADDSNSELHIAKVSIDFVVAL